MAEADRVKIKPLESGDDYRLWKIRIEAACHAKELEDVLSRERNPCTPDEVKKAKFAADMKKASGIIVAALTNEPLRIVRSEVGKPYNMLKKLNDRYDSKSAASRISKMTELVSLRYDNLSKDIGAHIDNMAGIIEQLAGMNTSIPDELSIALLIAPIHVKEMAPIAAAIKTLPDDAATWEKVTARFIEEHHSLKIRKSTERALMGNKHCEICERDGHFTKECWLNPKNLENRLPKATKSKDGERKPTKKDDKSTDGKKKKRSPKPKPTRAAVAKVNYCAPEKENRMMLDSGTTTHMTPDESDLCNKEDCSVSMESDMDPYHSEMTLVCVPTLREQNKSHGTALTVQLRYT